MDWKRFEESLGYAIRYRGGVEDVMLIASETDLIENSVFGTVEYSSTAWYVENWSNQPFWERADLILLEVQSGKGLVLIQCPEEHQAKVLDICVKVAPSLPVEVRRPEFPEDEAASDESFCLKEQALLWWQKQDADATRLREENVQTHRELRRLLMGE